MSPESLAGLQFIASSKSAPTVAAFLEKFTPYGQVVLDSIIVSHVDEVKGKLVLNQAGKAIVEHESKK